MAATIKQVIENIKELSADERAFVAHCLISSLEIRHDENVDEAWAVLAEKRYAELAAGSVKAISWEEIKSEIKG